MANWEWFTRLHRSVYRHTGGRLGARLWGLDMLLLTTRGRKTGQPRTLPLACFQDGDDWIVVASNNGQERLPAWWLNLQADPTATVQVRGEEFTADAREATPDEHARLWPWLKEQNHFYARYEATTERPIPVVILHRRPTPPKT
ncbi:MAG: nitroreductase family deazaflavin-dependent oxidoreductase [Proteobacteria bacterium]|nr:nitroreductase family deazaflavin-dependent oxidoreductase [Pseudomonadota bacterium]